MNRQGAGVRRRIPPLRFPWGRWYLLAPPGLLGALCGMNWLWCRGVSGGTPLWNSPQVMAGAPAFLLAALLLVRMVLTMHLLSCLYDYLEELGCQGEYHRFAAVISALRVRRNGREYRALLAWLQDHPDPALRQLRDTVRTWSLSGLVMVIWVPLLVGVLRFLMWY